MKRHFFQKAFLEADIKCHKYLNTYYEFNDCLLITYI